MYIEIWQNRRYLLIGVLLAVIIFTVITSLGRIVPKKGKKIVASKLPDTMSVTGKTINQYHNGKKLYTLKIGKFRICSKKIGFVKIGFLKIAMINDVVMDIYLGNLDEGKELSLDDNVVKSDDFTIFKHLETDSDWETMIRRYKIKGVEIKGIKINFHRGEKTVCSISSKSASMEYKNKDFILKGNTTIVADNRILKSHKIIWQNNNRKFLVNGKYELIEQDSVKRGECLKTDFLLRKIEYCENKVNEET